MKRNKLMTTVGLCAGAAIFATTALASYITPNGYDALKETGKKMISTPTDNYTLSMQCGFTLNGEEMTNLDVSEKVAKGTDIPYQRTETNKYAMDGNTNKYMHFVQDGNRYILYNDGLDVDKYDPDDQFDDGVLNDFVVEESDKETTDKVMRFVELLSDTVIGDVKNNFLYLGEENSLHRYEIELDKVQIPEIINAGLSAMASVNGQYYDEDADYAEDDPMALMTKDAWIDGVKLSFAVDEEYNLVDLDGVISFVGVDQNGENNTMDMSMKLSITDRGTTVPEKIDLSTLPPASEKDYSEDTEVNIETAEEIDE